MIEKFKIRIASHPRGACLAVECFTKYSMVSWTLLKTQNVTKRTMKKKNSVQKEGIENRIQKRIPHQIDSLLNKRVFVNN